MNLNKAEQVKAMYDGMIPEVQADLRKDSDQAKAYLAAQLPTLPETDRAVVAAVMATAFGELMELSVANAGKSLEALTAAYGLASVDLLGWFDVPSV